MEMVLQDTAHMLQYLAVFGLGLFMLVCLVTEYNKIMGCIALLALILLALIEWTLPPPAPFLNAFIAMWILLGFGFFIHWVYFEKGDEDDGSKPNEHL